MQTPHNATEENLLSPGTNPKRKTLKNQTETRGSQGMQNSECKTNKTTAHDVIAEEQVEESGHNTKR